MQVELVFFDNEMWSYHAFLLVIIPIVLLLLSTGELTIQDMIFLSLLGMMKGDLLPKIVLTVFLCLLVFVPTVGWLTRSTLYMASVLLMDRVKMNNVVHRAIMNSTVLQLPIKILIAVWMGYISCSIISDMYIANGGALG